MVAEAFYSTHSHGLVHWSSATSFVDRQLSGRLSEPRFHTFELGDRGQDGILKLSH